MDSEAPCALQVQRLVSGYGTRKVLNGVSLEVARGEIVSLIGHNGAGKSTVLKAVFGIAPIWAGGVAIDGRWVSRPVPEVLLRAGVVYVPQGNSVFAELSVRANLEIAGGALLSKSAMKDGMVRVLELFQELKARLRQRAGTLSGGERQMLALARALVLAPRLLLLDEPSLGLSPQAAAQTFRSIQEASRTWGAAILVVEQRIREVLRIARRAYVMKNGGVSYSGPAEALTDEARLREVLELRS